MSATKKAWRRWQTPLGHSLMRNLNGSTRLRVTVENGYATLRLYQGIYAADTVLGWDIKRHASDRLLKKAAMEVARSYVRLLKEAGL